MSVCPHIHILFASEPSKAVVVRRGPSKWVQILLWDTKTDSIEPGSWFHGRIYEEGCSLSPDGQLFAYFATKYHGPKTRGVNYAYTAISRPPWLKALAIWPMDDTWGGNTKFVDNQTLMIDCPHWEKLHTEDTLPEGMNILPRWVGIDAPEQSLPEIPKSSANYYNGKGIDQRGKSFTYKNGKLLREENVIIDLASMKPDPTPPPENSKFW